MFKFAISVFGLLGLSLFLIGCVYLSLNEFMPYHAEALQVSWADLNPNYRGLILGLIKGLGGGAFVAGFAILFMVGVSVKKSPQPFTCAVANCWNRLFDIPLLRNFYRVHEHTGQSATPLDCPAYRAGCGGLNSAHSVAATQIRHT